MRVSRVLDADENNYNLDEGLEMALHCSTQQIVPIQSTSHHVRGLVIHFKYVRCALNFDFGVKRQL